MFIQVEDPQNLRTIEGEMDKYIQLQNEMDTDWAITSFGFEPLATLHKKSGNIRNAIVKSTDDGYTAIIFLAFVGVFMLFLACFNYINIAIVSAAKRLKEIGIRKTIGATRRIVIIQFLTENIFITAFALVLGLALGMFVFIPWFEGLFFFDMGFRIYDPTLWIYLPTILIFTGVISGIYPAFYISRFPVTSILKGAVKFGKRNPLTKVILGFQLILSCMFITSAIMFTQNSYFLINRGWGYDKESTLYVNVPDKSGFDQMQTLVSQDPNIISTSGSQHHVGRIHASTILQTPDRQYEVDHFCCWSELF